MSEETSARTLWSLVVAYAAYIALSVAGLLPLGVSLLIAVSLPAVFAILHGAVRYKWRGILAFVLITFVISSIFENVGVATGFPFGHYCYTKVLGQKLFYVPLLVAPAYFGTGYLSWMLASVIVGQVRRGGSRFTTIAVPFVASFIMVSWDVCFDPASSTLNKEWIWKNGGGYFGVPLTNYLGWFLTVYVLFQTFALYLRAKDRRDESDPPLAARYWWQAITFYGLIAVQFPLDFLVAEPGTMVDKTGTVWIIRDFRETAAIASLCTMFFAVAVASVKLLQERYGADSVD